MERLAILGASGHGKVVADAAELMGWREIVFYDDAWPSKTENGHWSVQGHTEQLIRQINQFEAVVVAIGNNRIRDQKTKFMIEKQWPLTTIIHPSAKLSRYAKVNKGSVIFANAVINADTIIGYAAILNTNCGVDHDCRLANAVHICPGANIAGGVEIGDRSWLGIGCCVRQSITIGADVLVGAGAVVVSHIASQQTVMGNPAKVK